MISARSVPLMAHDFPFFSDDGLKGIYPATIDESIKHIKQLPSENAILNQLFSTLFFARPVMMLRNIVSLGKNVTCGVI